MSDGRRRTGSDHGFSLIELIVVIVIIGVLAAVAVPTYAGIRERSIDAAARSDLVHDREALLSYGLDHDGALPPASLVNENDLKAYDFVRGPSTVSIDYSVQGSASSGAWCLLAVSAVGRTYTVSTHTTVSSGTTTSCPTTY